MKKLKFVLPCIVLLVAAATGVFYGYSTAQQRNGSETSIYSQINQLGDKEVAKLAYRNLSTNEQYNLWVDKFNLALNSGILNERQKNVVVDLMKHLSPDLFGKGSSDKREIFFLGYGAQWMKSAETCFTHTQINDLFFSMNGTNFNNKKSVGRLASYSFATAERCTCSTESITTCWHDNSWHKCTEEHNCDETEQGCGWLGTAFCDGDKCA